MKQFQPVLLGSDINAYGMARAFHMEYGIVSTAFAYFQLAPTRFTKIIDVHLVEDFGKLDTFKKTLIDYGKQMKAANPERVLLLIPCGDLYANLLSACASDLKEYYVFNTLSPALNKQLSYKNTFYETCEQYGLPHPKTKVVTAEGVKRGDYKKLPFDFPIAMKPADSAAWLNIDFPGRKKAFIIETPDELDVLIRSAYGAGYKAEMILQDFIPGDDSHDRVLNAYVDQHHRVRMMFLGHPLLEDPTPEAVGNYAVIMPDYNKEICLKIKGFLEAIGYEGVANFDMKFDERDGQYKLFEINLRQGRSSFFVTLNSYNLARYFVDDLVEDAPFDGQTEIGKGDKLWMEVPKSIFEDYATESADKARGEAMIKAGDWGTTLEYSEDHNLRRSLLIRHAYSIYKKRYAEFFKQKADLK